MLKNRRNLGGGERSAELLSNTSHDRKPETRECGYGI